MTWPHFPKRQPRIPARDQLRKSPGVPFLFAMDLVMIQCEEAQRTVHRRLDPAEAREELQELKQIKHAASQAKIQWLQHMRKCETSLAEAWLHSEDPTMAQIGSCLLSQSYERLAR